MSCWLSWRQKETVFAFAQVFSTSLWGGMLVPIGDKPSSIADRSVRRLPHLLWDFGLFLFLQRGPVFTLLWVFMWKQILKYSYFLAFLKKIYFI